MSVVSLSPEFGKGKNNWEQTRAMDGVRILSTPSLEGHQWGARFVRLPRGVAH